MEDGKARHGDGNFSGGVCAVGRTGIGRSGGRVAVLFLWLRAQCGADRPCPGGNSLDGQRLCRTGVRCSCGLPVFLSHYQRCEPENCQRTDGTAQELRAGCERAAGCYSEYSARLMFSLCILFWSVVRFSPRRSAAPPLPAILPEAAIKASIMACRSACSKLGAAEATERTAGFFSSAGRTFNSSPCVKITQRSMKFSNCRILPGQSAFASTSMACFGTDLMRFCIRRERRDTKKCTSS